MGRFEHRHVARLHGHQPLERPRRELLPSCFRPCMLRRAYNRFRCKSARLSGCRCHCPPPRVAKPVCDVGATHVGWSASNAKPRTAVGGRSRLRSSSRYSYNRRSARGATEGPAVLPSIIISRIVPPMSFCESRPASAAFAAAAAAGAVWSGRAVGRVEGSPLNAAHAVGGRKGALGSSLARHRHHALHPLTAEFRRAAW